MAENMSGRLGNSTKVRTPIKIDEIDGRTWLTWAPILMAFSQGFGENASRALSSSYVGPDRGSPPCYARDILRKEGYHCRYMYISVWKYYVWPNGI